MPLSQPSLRRLRARALAAALALFVPAATAGAENLASGPVLLLGYSPDKTVTHAASDLALMSFGWRWRRDGADLLDDLFAKAGTDFSWSVEALVGGVFGDAEAFEGSLVPYVRFAPAGWDRVTPYFEGGIGLAYTTLSNYGLGSELEFSDNVGVGVAFGGGDGRPRWSIGYRFRHLSHAGIFDDQNDGLNAHFLTFSME